MVGDDITAAPRSTRWHKGQLHSLDASMPSLVTCSTGVAFGEQRWLLQLLTGIRRGSGVWEYFPKQKKSECQIDKKCEMQLKGKFH